MDVVFNGKRRTTVCVLCSTITVLDYPQQSVQDKTTHFQPISEHGFNALIKNKIYGWTLYMHIYIYIYNARTVQSLNFKPSKNDHRSYEFLVKLALKTICQTTVLQHACSMRRHFN